MNRSTVPPAPDALPCGLIVATAAGEIAWVNQTLRDWIGLGPEEPLGCARIDELLVPAEPAVGRRGLDALLRQGQPLFELPVSIARRDASELPMSVTASRRDDGSGLFDFVLIPARQMQSAQEELRQTQEELRMLVHESTRHEADATDRALFAEQIVGIVSHDLRNPLSALHTGLTALGRSQPTEQQQRMLERMGRSLERANRLVADLLDFTAARLGAGLSSHARAIDLHEVVGEALEELRLAFAGREIQHVREGDGWCLADPDRLAQLLGNLVGNAMAYGAAGEPVRVVSRVDGGEGEGEVSVGVHNHGRPIPPENLERIFVPLVRGEGDGRSRSVGLGLYIVEQIAKAHGGEVRVESQASAGTTFTVNFPRNR
ncbi:PAS domain-containing protein [Xylophilus rhododendri]|uniref:histidine kinase n=1 Tax=Xylophilus rhododendri TaxID=2697032 RepID=A0A857J6Q7_9BURK|nr:PAS domain-containing sensor histidine kinase [Xylophilus rhododendri]QHI99516.1 PAS domain-containing protein [Xylophilus rhododendri]